ncbi:MAG: TetR/AcrR family transcriptional regulator [Cyanobacteria bacterium P01_A01_bin.114]
MPPATSKAATTRTHILQQSAIIFNRQGFAGASIADLMKATGLKKGGIYNHFKSKDDIALAAFEQVFTQMGRQYWQALRSHRHAVDRLQAMLHAFPFREYEQSQDPLLRGGCPLLNLAVESDDTHPALRAQVAAALGEWQTLITRVVQKGIDRQEICPDTHPEKVAAVVIAALEGGVMLVKLYDDVTFLESVVEHLDIYLEGLRTAG